MIIRKHCRGSRFIVENNNENCLTCKRFLENYLYLNIRFIMKPSITNDNYDYIKCNDFVYDGVGRMGIKKT